MRYASFLKQELKIAFAKDAQPLWFRLLKYSLIFPVVFFFWSQMLFWIALCLFAVISICLHFWYRKKTAGWTKSYGLWKPSVKKLSNKAQEMGK